MYDPDFDAVLRELHAAGIKFILVGGVAAVIHGAPTDTFDIDIVHSREASNVERLLPMLEAWGAVYRIQPERRLKPKSSSLVSPGHQNLITKFGPLDLLGTIGNDLSYEDLLPHSEEMNFGEGVRIRVLSLEKLIEIKEQLGGEKDRAMLPILRRTLEERKKLT